MQLRLTRALGLCVLILPMITSAAAASVDSSDRKRLGKAAEVITTFRTDGEHGIPSDLWAKAACVAVIPDMTKAAFIFGGEHGKGVLSCRTGNGWSAPAFIEMTKGSWGFQAGVQQMDLVLLIMNRSGAEQLLAAKVELGADASVAAGPVGRTASAGTDIGLGAGILAYSRAKGVFAGIDLSGGALTADKDANAEAYGTTDAKMIVFGNTPAPPEAVAFVRALGGGPRATTGTVAPRPAPATGTKPKKAPKY